jgi:hypothetical protein
MPDSNATHPQLIVDLSSNTGAIKYGASGFLYGLGNDGIPSVNMLAPIKPQVAAQKPEGGPQHPNGDALNVSDTYKAAGGKEIEIYMQDIFAEWPYEFTGIEDYLIKVEGIVRQIIAGPNRSLFSYVPLNEPDQIWYNKSDKKQALFDDWKLLYQKIRSLDSTARIVGPNFAKYDSASYSDFLIFARDNHCLPDVISWHELNDDFFPEWYSHYGDYRDMESNLGLPAREICINEYARISGDLGIPGKLVQWIARFEDSKVDACLAYWTTAGCLNDLVARDHYNQATGGWWLYKWYGSLTGHTIKVTPPQVNVEGLQGLACLDSEKKQARILFGGSNGIVDIVLKGFGAASYFGDKVHVAVWAAVATGTNPAEDPVLLMEGGYAIANGEICVSVNDTVDTTAYQMIITPATAQSSVGDVNRYEAEYADLSGGARVSYGVTTGYSGTGFVDCGNNASIAFIVTANQNGFYHVRLRYSAGPVDSESSDRSVRMILNGSPLMDVPIPATIDWNTWADTNINVFLIEGINRLAFEAITNNTGLNIDYIDVTAGHGMIDSYEAESVDNTLSGTAMVTNDSAASGGRYVGQIGNGVDNTLQFNNVTISSGGTHRMVVYFANAERKGDHQYNTQVVDRYADISVNGRTIQRVYFRNTFSWNTYRTRVIDVDLDAGDNTIKFSNPSAYAPHIDKIEIASRF